MRMKSRTTRPTVTTLIDTKQAAERLGLSLRQVERLCRVSEWMGATDSFQGNEEDRVIGSCPQSFVSAPWRSCSHATRTSVRLGRREAERAARPTRLGRDTAALDDRSRALGTPLSADASRSSAPASPIELR